MPYTVDDADFSKLMLDLQVSNTISEKILKEVDFMKWTCYLVIALEIITVITMYVEWRFPHLIKKWFYPPESDKTVSLVANAV